MASPQFLFVINSILVIFKAATAEVGLLRAEEKGGDSGSGGRGEDDEPVFCLAYNSHFHSLPSSYKGQSSAGVANHSDQDGCSTAYNSSEVSGKVVVVARGNCSFVEKAALIQKAGGLAALIVDYANESKMTEPGGNQSEYLAINITVALMLKKDFIALSELGAGVAVWMYSPDPPHFDPNIVVMFSVATLCVMAGAFFSATTHHRRKQRRLAARSKKKGARGKVEEEEEEENSVSLGMGIAMSVALVVFFCLSLTLLYFFYDYLVYMIIGIFCLAGVSGLYQALSPLFKRLLPCEARVPLCVNVSWLTPPPQLRSLALLLLCAGFVATWVVFRHASFGWILQDIIGFCFCLYVMRTLLMPSLKACTILLGLLFIYDIFFVFITPLFTKNGESVMIKVATGGDSKSGEQMPTVFKMPYFLPWALSRCITDKYSLLGYGDVIVPGLLVTYNCAFDLKTQHAGQDRWRFLYYMASCIGYMVGLVMTGGGLYLMRSGQPALLYLVPCTVLTTLAVACWRRELGHIWRGHQNPKKNDDAAPTPNTPAPRLAGNIQDGGATEEEEEEEQPTEENHSLLQ